MDIDELRRLAGISTVKLLPDYNERSFSNKRAIALKQRKTEKIEANKKRAEARFLLHDN